MTCLIIIVDEGNAARFPFAPAAKSNAASPHAFPTQRVNIGGLTYLQQKVKVSVADCYKKQRSPRRIMLSLSSSSVAEARAGMRAEISEDVDVEGTYK